MLLHPDVRFVESPYRSIFTKAVSFKGEILESIRLRPVIRAEQVEEKLSQLKSNFEVTSGSRLQ